MYVRAISSALCLRSTSSYSRRCEEYDYGEMARQHVGKRHSRYDKYEIMCKPKYILSILTPRVVAGRSAVKT